ncbi:hypothetical protein [Streptomyces sp. NPDC090298]|uniref:hypothetical protein n=1 Tax=Streptomyces sp. NPDC090298 TaxID=3365959 RepID=UPI00382E0288
MPEAGGPDALVIGCSAGYGLAAALAGLKRACIRSVVLSFEKAPTARRSAGTAPRPPPTSLALPGGSRTFSTVTRSSTR